MAETTRKNEEKKRGEVQSNLSQWDDRVKLTFVKPSEWPTGFHDRGGRQ